MKATLSMNVYDLEFKIQSIYIYHQQNHVDIDFVVYFGYHHLTLTGFKFVYFSTKPVIIIITHVLLSCMITVLLSTRLGDVITPAMYSLEVLFPSTHV